MINLIPPQYRLLALIAAIALVALASFAAAWRIQSWRYSADIATLKQEWADERASIAFESLIGLQKATEKAAALQSELSEIAKQHAEELSNEQNENQRLRLGIERGDYRVYVRAHCPRTSTVSTTTHSGSVDTQATAELDANTRQDYYRLRDAIRSTEATLTACQMTLAAITDQR